MKELRKFELGRDYKFEEIEAAAEEGCHHFVNSDENRIGFDTIKVFTDEGDAVIFVFTSVTKGNYYYTCVYNEFTNPKFIKKP